MTELAVRAILFDLDGTLVDSTASVDRSWRLIADELKLSHDAVVGRFHGMTGADTLRLVLPSLAAEKVAELNQRLIEAELADVDGVRPTKGARRTLSALPGDRWAIVTSCGRRLALARLAAAGLPVPKLMITAEDVRTGKPDPAPYAMGAQRLGLRPEHCLAVEDAPAGVASATAAGCHVLGIAAAPSALDADTVPDLEAVTVRAGHDLVHVRY